MSNGIMAAELVRERQQTLMAEAAAARRALEARRGNRAGRRENPGRSGRRPRGRLRWWQRLRLAIQGL